MKDSKSIDDVAKDAMRSFSNSISPALKRMKQAYFDEVQSNCYQEHHISDDFTNLEQINLCKQEKHDEIFGDYQNTLRNHRDSDVLRLQHCRLDAGDNIERVYNCFGKYIEDIHETNKSLHSYFRDQHKQWM